jgi:alkylation response protein AidB-like acyl-CoA dehydrogenase
MDFSFTEEQQILKETIVRFASKELNDRILERDRQHLFPQGLWLKAGELRLQGLPVPEKYGGSGLDPLSTAIALEALGYGCEDSGLVFSICAHLLSCVIPIWKFGSEEQKQRYLSKLCNGSFIGVHAMTEPGAGSDAFAMTTKAEACENGYRINGTKTFISNGSIADLVIVFAVTNPAKGYYGGVTAFIVEKATAGFRASQTFEKMGLRTAPLSELVFDGVWVRPDAVLGGVGAGSAIFSHAMDWERVCLFASHVGTMERLLEKTIAYAVTRRQFGQVIGKYQGVSHRIADMKVHLEAARLLVYKAASLLDRTKTVSLDAAMAKLFVSESLVKIALDSLQIHGGNGYMVEYGLERAVRDAIGSTIYSGTSEIQRNIIARWLGL